MNERIWLILNFKWAEAMSRKHYAPKQIIGMLRGLEVRLSQGESLEQ